MGGLLDPGTWAGKLFSGGWREGGEGRADVTEPATGDVLGEVGMASAEDVSRAARAAAKAQGAWADASYEERGEVLRRAAALIEEHEDEISEWLVRESGSIRPKVGVEVHGTRNELLEAAAMTSRPYGNLIPSVVPGRLSMARRVPVGVVGVISPWNFPLLLAMRSVAPALAVGNAVVLKPDPQTAVCGGFSIARLFEEAGLSEGVLHVLPGGAEAGSAVVEDPNVHMISFTGSTAVGRIVGAEAGKALKKVSLELGGNNAYIVLDDADVEVASSVGALGSFFHQGQICMTAGRHLVHESVADEYLERLAERAKRLPVGNPYTEQVAIGPLINEKQLERVDGIVRETVAAGAAVKAGGTHEGLVYRPTVLGDVPTASRAFSEEIFGPVAPVVTFSTEDEAVEIANSTEYGLTAAIQTRSVSRGMALGNRLHAGIVHINDGNVNDEAHAPFGGVGASGNGGRFGGDANWEEFTEWQWMTVRDEAQPTPF